MMPPLLPALLALALAFGPPPVGGAGAAGAQGAPEEALLAGRLRAASAADEGAQRELLEELLAAPSPAGAQALRAEYAQASHEARSARDRARRHAYALERGRALRAVMEVRAERDPSLVEVVARMGEDLREKERLLAEAQERQAAGFAWCERLGEAVRALHEALPTGARRKALEDAWDAAEDGEDLVARMGALEILGRVADGEAPLRLHAVLADVEGERIALEKRLPRLEDEVHEFEERMQRENEATGGRTYRGTPEQYERVRAEASAIRTTLTRLGHVVDAAAEAAGRSLARLAGEEQARALAKLVRIHARSKGTLRTRTLDVLGHARGPEVQRTLLAMLGSADDPGDRGSLVDALAAQGDPALVAPLVAGPLADPSWHVRSRAVQALASLRAKEAIAPLVERLELEEGRLATDVARALASLTGQDFRARADLWRAWWREAEAGFVVPPLAAPAEGGAAGAGAEDVGVTFFGIRTESQRVLFVLDVSLSMTFSMVPHGNPDDGDGRRPDMPREGEDSRIDVAKRELVRAIGGVADGGVFNLVLFASDVWTWRDELVEMEPATRAEALAFVERIEPMGGTNLYGALAQALDLAGVREDGEWREPLVDTVFLLSDGRPMIGVTTDPDEILAYVRERNRAAGLTIHTIGLSGAQDAYLLRSLAEQSGGSYAAR